MLIQAFSPGSSYSIACSTSSASVTLTAQSNNLRVCNTGTVVAYMRVTTGASTATTSDMAVPPGNTEVFSVSPTANTVSAITGSSTTTLNITQGEGM